MVIQIYVIFVLIFVLHELIVMLFLNVVVVHNIKVIWIAIVEIQNHEYSHNLTLSFSGPRPALLVDHKPNKR